MKVVLVRHGPTAWNATGRFQGLTDVPLSPQGRRHAAAIAAALGDDEVRAVYSSDLIRALETARIIAAERSAPLTMDPRLREFHFGDWEGLTWDEIVARNPALKGRSSKEVRRYAPGGGESFAEVRARVKEFFDALLAQSDGGANVIVTHAGVLHAIFCELGLDDSLPFTPGGISRVTIENGSARLVARNDVEHLERVD